MGGARCDECKCCCAPKKNSRSHITSQQTTIFNAARGVRCVIASTPRVVCRIRASARYAHSGFFGRDVIFPTRPVVIETSRASLVKHNACCTRHRRSTVPANALQKAVIASIFLHPRGEIAVQESSAEIDQIAAELLDI